MLATLVIEVAAKKETGIVEHNGVCTYYILAVGIFPFKMGINIGITQRLKFAVRTFCTFILFFIAIR